MPKLFFSLAILALALIVELQGAPAVENQTHLQVDPLLVRTLLDTDFENGMGVWFDSSSGEVSWLVETVDSLLESSPAPQPSEGSKYLRAVRRTLGSSGMAVLRSPVFTAFPGDSIAFKFWIRSERLQTNSLEVFWLNGTREVRLLSLNEYSSPANFDWHTVSVQLPVPTSLDTRIIFYGYCGYNEGDAIAIDEIQVGSHDSTTTTSTTITTTPLTTTTEAVSTTAAPPLCPVNLESEAPCYKTSTGCYCYHQRVKTWYEADTFCRRNQMKLVSLESAEEQDAVVNIIREKDDVADSYYFTSGTYSTSLTKWVWGSGVPFNYTNWDVSQPSGNGDCLYLKLNADYKWGDLSSTVPIRFICEQ